MVHHGSKWDQRFLALAEYVSRWSKDPSTKTGAVIVDDRRRIVSMGYNGFPPGIEDTPERLNNREVKYELVVHCEINALANAGRPVDGLTLYTWPFLTCTRCTMTMIAAGIGQVVAPECPEDKKERWGASLDQAKALWTEAERWVVLYGPTEARHYFKAYVGPHYVVDLPE